MMMSDGLVCAECKKVCANRKVLFQHRRRSGHGFQRPERRRQPIRIRECRRRRSAAESSRSDGDRTTTACGGGGLDDDAGVEQQSGSSSKRSKKKHGTPPVVVADGDLSHNGWVVSRRTNSDNSCYFKHVSGRSFKSRRAAEVWAEQSNMAPPRAGRLGDLRTKAAHGGGLSLYFAKKTTKQCVNAKPLPRRPLKLPTKQCQVCLSKANPIAVLRCVGCHSEFPPRRKKKRAIAVALRQAPAPAQGTVLLA